MNLDQVIAMKGSLDDLLFRGKNKSYGAYDLRKSYPLHLKKSLETAPPPPPPPPPPPVKATIQFVPPKIVEVAPPDEEIKTVDEIKESKAEISTTTVVGQDLDDLDAGTDAGVEAPRSDEPLVFAEQMPEFPGGDDALMAYLQRNIKYPAFALENEIEGVVMVNFVVNSDGSISKVNVTKGIKGGCDEEASRVVRNMPKWKPGKQGGQPVPVYFDVPVNFKIE